MSHVDVWIEKDSKYVEVICDESEKDPLSRLVQSSNKWKERKDGSLLDGKSRSLHRLLLFGDDKSRKEGVSFVNGNKLDLRRDNMVIKSIRSKNLILFFDTETTGLPSKTQYGQFFDGRTNPNAYRFARLLSIAWVMVDKDTKSIHGNFHIHIIKPSFDFSIRNSDIHGITDAIAMEKGEDLKKVLEIFYQEVQKADQIVAHNMKFDYNIVKFEALSKCSELAACLERYKRTDRMICTWKLTQKSLNDMYKDIMGKEREPCGCHDALNDTNDLVSCYIEKFM
jgi:DNA polymerase III epsilon subunit-like protein